MPKTLAHPTSSPTTDVPVFGDILTGGGAVLAGKTKVGDPVSNYVLSPAGVWIPQSATAAGASLVSEYNADAILAACSNLFNEMRENRQAAEGVRSELLKQTELGMAMQAYQTMPGIKVGTDGHPAVLSAQRQGIAMGHDLGQLAFDCQRKYVGDVGAYVSPAAVNGVQVTFTGVNLFGRAVICFNATDRMYHSISQIVDPAGGAVGTFQVSPPIPSANAVLRIPFTSLPFAYNSAADATQTIAVAAPPKGVNGPAVLLSNAALAEAGAPTTYSLPVPVANYDLFTVWIFWDGSAGGGGNDDTYSWNIFGRTDDQAVGDWIDIGAAWGTTVGSAYGVAAVTGLSAWRPTVRTQLRELDIRRTKTVVGVAGTCNIRVWIMLGR